MKNRIISILGGTGFVGQHLVHRLTKEGYSVRVLTRRPERHRALIVNPAVRLVEANVSSLQDLHTHLAGAGTVINLVGILNEHGRKDSGFQQLHVELPQKIATAAVECGVGRLLHMSALNANAGETLSHYLRTKGEGENRVHAAARDGLLVTSFRPSVIFGPGDSFFNRFASLLKLTPLVFPLACPNSRFAPVFIGDVGDAFCRALQDDSTGGQRLELCGPDSYTLQELVEYTRDILAMKQHIVGLGNGLSRLQARVLGMMPGKPFSMDNYYSMQTDSLCKNNALPALGITPTPVAAVVPGYLADRHIRGNYNRFRRTARR
jgi:NADH dehydrogenase